MISQENKIIFQSALATVTGIFALVLLAEFVPFPGDSLWVIGFLWFVGVGYVWPQVSLIKRDDDDVSTVSRMGVITFIIVILTPSFIEGASGIAQEIIWSVALLAVVAMCAYQLREGYRQSKPSESI